MATSHLTHITQTFLATETTGLTTDPEIGVTIGELAKGARDRSSKSKSLCSRLFGWIALPMALIGILVSMVNSILIAVPTIVVLIKTSNTASADLVDQMTERIVSTATTSINQFLQDPIKTTLSVAQNPYWTAKFLNVTDHLERSPDDRATTSINQFLQDPIKTTLSVAQNPYWTAKFLNVTDHLERSPDLFVDVWWRVNTSANTDALLIAANTNAAGRMENPVAPGKINITMLGAIKWRGDCILQDYSTVIQFRYNIEPNAGTLNFSRKDRGPAELINDNFYDFLDPYGYGVGRWKIWAITVKTAGLPDEIRIMMTYKQMFYASPTDTVPKFMTIADMQTVGNIDVLLRNLRQTVRSVNILLDSNYLIVSTSVGNFADNGNRNAGTWHRRRVPRADFYAGIDRGQKQALILSICITITSAALGSAALALMIRPLADLTRTMQQITKFDFSAIQSGKRDHRSVVAEMRRMEIVFDNMCKALARERAGRRTLAKREVLIKKLTDRIAKLVEM
ncbi:hypothetical protein BDZ88DRAFT_442183 [Geranomyces variabilis]|nr:hypothetical protein BDZ88DRAFT_442183 [Geranomyces variabilis]KAJ3138230.1 hypothetical protein HDU90_001192 [Geranomyces variabilis]